MSEKAGEYNAHAVEGMILVLRGQKVILDSDLARVYGVTTKRLNEQVRRNKDRFPSDFVFQLTLPEAAHLKSQMVTSSITSLRSQFATSNKGREGGVTAPYAFTEHGAVDGTLMS